MVSLTVSDPHTVSVNSPLSRVPINHCHSSNFWTRIFFNTNLRLWFQVMLTGDISETDGFRLFRSRDFGMTFVSTDLPFEPHIQMLYNPEDCEALLTLSIEVSRNRLFKTHLDWVKPMLRHGSPSLVTEPYPPTVGPVAVRGLWCHLEENPWQRLFGQMVRTDFFQAVLLFTHNYLRLWLWGTSGRY